MTDLGLSEAGKEELALALLLWKNFKSQGKFDVDISVQMLKLADTLGVQSQLETLIPKMPLFDIKLREL